MKKKSKTPLLNPFLPLFRIRVPGGTETPLMPRNQTTNHFVLPNIADSLLVPFSGPRSRVELWPVDLLGLASNIKILKGRDLRIASRS